MLAAFQFAFDVTAPIFLIIFFGVVLRKRRVITEDFAKSGSDLVFRVTLPALLFSKVAVADFSNPPLALVGYACGSLLILFLFTDKCLAPLFHKDDRGVMVQGVLRSNFGIIGLAYCLSAFGDGVMPIVSVFLACTVILINILSVVTLCKHHGGEDGHISVWTTVGAVLRNPLIWSIVVALLVSYFKITINTMIMETLEYLARVTLPLALLCVGASIRWHEFRASKSLYFATALKLLFFPLITVVGAVLFGFRGEELGVLYLMTAAPTAAASYPMVRAIGGNYHLAAAIVAATSLCSIASTTIGLFILKSFQLI